MVEEGIMGRLALRPALRAHAHAPGAAEEPWTNTKSILFDGTDDFYYQASALTTTTGQKYSWSLWVKMDSSVRDDAYLFHGADPSDASTHEILYVVNGKLYYYPGGSTVGVISTTAEFGLDAWKHIVVTYGDTAPVGTADAVRMWIDGVEVAASNPFNGAGNESGLVAPLYFGSKTTATSWYLAGNMDEVGFLKGVALTDSEVGEIYNSGDPTDLESGPQSSSLYLYYRFGDTEGDGASAITDVKGNIDRTGSGGLTVSTDVPS